MLWSLEIQTAIAEIPSKRVMGVDLSTSEKKWKPYIWHSYNHINILLGLWKNFSGFTPSVDWK